MGGALVFLATTSLTEGVVVFFFDFSLEVVVGEVVVDDLGTLTSVLSVFVEDVFLAIFV